MKRKKVPQYDLGGFLSKALPAAAGFIPGIGPAVSAGLTMAGQVAGQVGNEPELIEQKGQRSYTHQGFAHGGAMNIGQNAILFKGPSHQNGGIPVGDGKEVEGGETMDIIEFRDGGIFHAKDGKPYVFSKRLKLPDSSATFADAHKRLVNKNANEDEIRELALLQEKVSGRSNNSEMSNGGEMEYANGGPADPPYGSNYDWLGNSIRNFFGFNTNPNAKIGNRTIDNSEVTSENPNNQKQPNLSVGNDPLASISNYNDKLGTGELLNRPIPRLEGSSIDADFSNTETIPLLRKTNFQDKPNIPKESSQESISSPDKKATATPTKSGSKGKTFNTDIGKAEMPETPEIGSLDNPPSVEIPKASSKGSSANASNNKGMNALQFIPEAMNFLTGSLSKPDNPDPTRVNNRGVDNFPTDINVNPQLLRNEQSYRAIASDPNATSNQKLAAQAQKMQADARVFGEKLNRETQLKANKSRLQTNIDRQNAQFADKARTEGMMSDAMFGPTGNMARGALASASQKLLMNQAQGNRERQDKIAAMSIISQLDPELQEKFVNQLGLLQ